jgi:hypothetical protein
VRPAPWLSESIDFLWLWKPPESYLVRQSVRCIVATALIDFMERIIIISISVGYAAIFVFADFMECIIIIPVSAITVYKFLSWLGCELVEDSAQQTCVVVLVNLGLNGFLWCSSIVLTYIAVSVPKKRQIIMDAS